MLSLIFFNANPFCKALHLGVSKLRHAESRNCIYPCRKYITSDYLVCVVHIDLISSQKPQEAREIMNGKVKDLPESDPCSQGAHPISFGAERVGHLLAFEQLGAGVCGAVYDSHFIMDGHNANCAAKVVEERFDLFWLEISAYEQLRGKQFVPKFYGAFAGMWTTAPLAMILMERLEKTFNSYEEMNTEEK